MQQSRKQSCIPSRFWPGGGIYQVWCANLEEADAEDAALSLLDSIEEEG